MKKDIVVLTTLLVIGLGWIFNIVKLLDADFESPYKNETIRVIGVFVPFVGAVTGWMDINDKQKPKNKNSN